jgi:peptidoglycan LD-endopeptidase LytH
MRLKYLVGGAVSRQRISHVLLSMVFVATLLPARTAAASNSTRTSDQVAAEILRVQAKADKTAKLFSAAEIRQQDVADQIQASQAKIAAVSAQYADLQAGLARIAIDRFTGGAAPSLLLVAGDMNATLQMDALKNIALDAGAGDLDALDAVHSDLQVEQAHLDALNAQNTQLLAGLATRQSAVESQLADLATLRDQLKNEEVKRAYDAQLAKQKQDEATAAAAADRDAKAAAEQAATASAFTAAASPLIAARGSGVKPSPQPQPSAAPARSSSDPTPASEPPAPPPDPAPAVVITDASWICPVAGPSAFGDTFGAPRPGGRIHEGVDMMSPFGTPLVAVVSGFANMHATTLGGNSISLAGDDGNGYFYAHLSSWEGSSRQVAAGEVIGYVGHTGDTTANHLHFEIHPGGGAAVDPYPTVRRYC